MFCSYTVEWCFPGCMHACCIQHTLLYAQAAQHAWGGLNPQLCLAYQFDGRGSAICTVTYHSCRQASNQVRGNTSLQGASFATSTLHFSEHIALAQNQGVTGAVDTVLSLLLQSSYTVAVWTFQQRQCHCGESLRRACPLQPDGHSSHSASTVAAVAQVHCVGTALKLGTYQGYGV